MHSYVCSLNGHMEAVGVCTFEKKIHIFGAGSADAEKVCFEEVQIPQLIRVRGKS